MVEPSRKRSRISEEVLRLHRPRPFRPIDKLLTSVQLNVTASGATLLLATASYPCTVAGLRWSLVLSHTATNVTANCSWAIVTVSHGYSPSAISLTNGTTFYAPEQAVMAFSNGYIRSISDDAGPVSQWFYDTVRTKRKLQVDDKLYLVARSDQDCSLRGIIQHFCIS